MMESILLGDMLERKEMKLLERQNTEQGARGASIPLLAAGHPAWVTWFSLLHSCAAAHAVSPAGSGHTTNSHPVCYQPEPLLEPAGEQHIAPTLVQMCKVRYDEQMQTHQH